MKIGDLRLLAPKCYVLTTIEALAREPSGQHWINPEAQCYPQDVAPPAATIKVRYTTTPGDEASIAASIHQNQAGISMVDGCPAGWVGVNPTEFD